MYILSLIIPCCPKSFYHRKYCCVYRSYGGNVYIQSFSLHIGRIVLEHTREYCNQSYFNTRCVYSSIFRSECYAYVDRSNRKLYVRTFVISCAHQSCEYDLFNRTVLVSSSRKLHILRDCHRYVRKHEFNGIHNTTDSCDSSNPIKSCVYCPQSDCIYDYVLRSPRKLFVWVFWRSNGWFFYGYRRIRELFGGVYRGYSGECTSIHDNRQFKFRWNHEYRKFIHYGAHQTQYHLLIKCSVHHCWRSEYGFGSVLY